MDSRDEKLDLTSGINISGVSAKPRKLRKPKSEPSETTETSQQIKKPRGRPRVPSSERKISKHPPGYANAYYHAKLAFRVKCPFCCREVIYQKLNVHVNTNKNCNLIRAHQALERIQLKQEEQTTTELQQLD
jgi:hypothetical protein